MRNTTRACLFGLAVLLVLSASACEPNVDLTKDLAIVDVTTGWFDAGVVKDYEGTKNKLVPTIAFKLKNVSGATIASVQINAVYHLVTEPGSEYGATWVKAIDANGLAPSASAGPFVLRGDFGHVGLQSRVQMLQNANFKDFTVDVDAKVGAQQWVKLGTFKIDRQLLTR